MVGNVKHCRDDAVFQFYQKNCALKIGLLVTLMTFSIQAVVFIDFFFFSRQLFRERELIIVLPGRAKSFMLKCWMNG